MSEREHEHERACVCVHKSRVSLIAASESMCKKVSVSAATVRHHATGHFPVRVSGMCSVCVCVCVCILTSCLDIDAACNASTAKTGHATTIHRWPKYVREVAAMKDEARVPVREAPDQRTPPTRLPKHQYPKPHQQQHHTTTTRPVPPPRHACRGTLRVRGADSLLSVDRAKWFSPAANVAKNTAPLDAEVHAQLSSSDSLREFEEGKKRCPCAET